MKMKIYTKRIAAAILLAAMVIALAGCGAGQPQEKRLPVDVLFDHVVDIGTYEALEFEEVNEYLAKKHDLWVGGCTAAATTV